MLTKAIRLTAGPLNAITDVPGIEVGHHTHEHIMRGITAVLCKAGASAGVSVRGSNPGTIQTDALAATAAGSLVHGIGLTGGSLQGLSAVTGIAEWLHSQGIGAPVFTGLIPIVPGAVILDFRLSDPSVLPTTEWGHQAAAAARAGAFARGNVGVGAGGTAGKGPGCVRTKGGVGTASLRLPGGIVVGALVVVNALGSMIHPATGKLYASDGGFDIPLLYHDPDEAPEPVTDKADAGVTMSNTTLAVIATNAALSKPQLIKIADLAHDGLARAIRPAHAMGDGDTIFAIAPHEGAVQLPDTTGTNLTDLIGAAAADATVLAILDAARETAGVEGWPSVAEAQAAMAARG